MYEFDKLSEAVTLLLQESTISEIGDYVRTKTTANLSLALPTRETQKKVIHFILEGDKDFSTRSLAEIASFIQTKINYDYSQDEDYLIVLDKELFSKNTFSERFSQQVLYNKQNIISIKELLAKQFNLSLTTLERNLSVYLNPLSKSSSTNFWDTNNPATPNNLDINDVIECLKTNPKVFKAFLESPSNWDKLSKPMQEKLKEVKEECKYLNSDTTKGIPVK